MLTGPTADNLVAAVASACRSGLDADSLRAAVLRGCAKPCRSTPCGLSRR